MHVPARKNQNDGTATHLMNLYYWSFKNLLKNLLKKSSQSSHPIGDKRLCSALIHRSLFIIAIRFIVPSVNLAAVTIAPVPLKQSCGRANLLKKSSQCKCPILQNTIAKVAQL